MNGPPLRLEGCRYQFAALCHQYGPQSADPLILPVNNLSWSKHIIAQRYRIRWLTERFFKHLKSNGFDLEELGFQSAKKIWSVVAIVVVLFVICVAEILRQFNVFKLKRKRVTSRCGFGKRCFERAIPWSLMSWSVLYIL